MVLIEAQGPRTVALGILLSFYLDFILVLQYFRFWSVLHKLQASSGKIGEAIRATQRQQYWRYIDGTANINGTVLRPALIGEAGALSAAALSFFRGFLYIRCASPISGARIAAPIVLALHKEHERIGKEWTSMRSGSPIVIELAY